MIHHQPITYIEGQPVVTLYVNGNYKPNPNGGDGYGGVQVTGYVHITNKGKIEILPKKVR